MIDDHELSVAILPANKRDFSARAGDHWRAPRRFDVLPGMKLVARTTKRVAASAEAAFKGSCDRSDGRSVAALPQNRLVSA
jgi:hypothetical protein